MSPESQTNKLEPVIFYVNGKRVPTVWNRKSLRPGSRVWVKLDNQGYSVAFSSTERADHVLHFVQWISPSEWFVPLGSSYKFDQGHRDTLSNLLAGRVTKDVVASAIANAESAIRPERMHLTSEQLRSPVSSWLSVAFRINLVQALLKPEVGVPLWSEYLPLVTYLCLTCFDALGQPDGWVTFESWLESNDPKIAAQRQQVFDGVQSKVGTNEWVRQIYRGYLDAFGARRSLFRFIDEVLCPEARQRLFESMDYSKSQMPPNIGKPIPLGYREKGEYLYRIRNLFTHQARSNLPGMHPALLPSSISGSGELAMWHGHRQWFESNWWYTVFTQGWPEILIETVLDGLAAVVSKFADLKVDSDYA